MKVKIGALRTALQKVTRSVSNSSGNGSTVTLTGENGILSVQKTDGSSFARATVAGESVEPFQMVVDGARMQSVLGTANPGDDLSITVEAKCLRLRFGKARIKLDKVDKEFMLLQPDQWNGANESFSTSGDVLKRALKHVAATTARNDTRFYLNGVLFTTEDKKISLVGTNGHMLTRVCTDIEAGALEDTIVPINVVESIIANTEADDAIVILSFNEKDKPRGIGFRTESFEVLCPAIEGKYPDFKRVIPDVEALELPFITVSAVEMTHAVERIGMVGGFKGNSKAVRIAIEGAAVTISEPNGESVDEVVAESASSDGKLEIGFDFNYLSTVLKAPGEEVIRLYFNPTADSSFTFTGKDSTSAWQSVVMPMRI